MYIICPKEKKENTFGIILSKGLRIMSELFGRKSLNFFVKKITKTLMGFYLVFKNLLKVYYFKKL